jgi:Fe/S biogenesis protein NfuA
VFQGDRHAVGVDTDAGDVPIGQIGSVRGGVHAHDGSVEVMSPLEALAADTGGATTSEPIISITPEALDQLVELRDDEPEAAKLGLRVAIASAPGEEFRYDLSFDEFLKAAFTDEVRTHDGMKVIIPGADVELLEGATLDYTSTQGLVIRNPNRPQAPVIEGLTSDDALSAEVEAMVAAEVNPALAAHGGFVTYVGHDGEGTAYLTMGGGCHGCSMSKMTMLDGVQTMLVDAIDQIERVRDLTDHETGENPFYS